MKSPRVQPSWCVCTCTIFGIVRGVVVVGGGDMDRRSGARTSQYVAEGQIPDSFVVPKTNSVCSAVSVSVFFLIDVEVVASWIRCAAPHSCNQIHNPETRMPTHIQHTQNEHCCDKKRHNTNKWTPATRFPVAFNMHAARDVLEGFCCIYLNMNITLIYMAILPNQNPILYENQESGVLP